MHSIRHSGLLPMLCFVLVPLFGQRDKTRPSGPPSDQNVVAFSTRAEDAQRGEIPTASPLIEGVFEHFVPSNRNGLVLDTDRYFLARFRWNNGPTADDLLHGAERTEEDQRLVDGLAHLMMPDWQGLDRTRYEYSFVRVEYLGDVRCLVYDVNPKNTTEHGFAGRVYIEDRSWSIVRFTGTSARADQLLSALRHADSRFRIDTWRMNIAKTQWASALTYVQEVPPLGEQPRALTKGQVRFWGYNKASREQPRSATDVFLSESPATEPGRAKRWNSPQGSARLFEQQAENNVLARLQRAHFLGPPGEVERLLEQVVINLVIPNRVALSVPVHCRVLLTTRLEAFTVGNTIVLSRGLVDILPSESALALVLAHQLAHIVLGHQNIDSQLAFPEILRISDAELLAKLRFRHTRVEELAADKAALELLDHSSYEMKMAEAGLAMQALQQYVQHLPGLIQPHFGEHIADADHVVRNNEMFRTAPVLDDELPDQIAVLPLGAKVFVNPSDGRLEFNRPEALVAPKLREKAGLAVTPFMPVLSYFGEQHLTSRGTTSAPTKAAASAPAKPPTRPPPSSISRMTAAQVRSAAGKSRQ